MKLFVTTIPPVADFIRDGRLRALALTAPARTSILPDLPTAAEAGMPGLDVSTWNALYAAAGTPAPILDRLNAEVTAFLANPAIQRRMAEIGAQPGNGTPADVAARVAREHAETVTVVREAGITAG